MNCVVYPTLYFTFHDSIQVVHQNQGKCLYKIMGNKSSYFRDKLKRIKVWL